MIIPNQEDWQGIERARVAIAWYQLRDHLDKLIAVLPT